MSNTAVYVIYHADCADGFGAAWAIHRHIGDTDPEDGGRVRYLPRKHGGPPPETNPEAEVIIVDFSYPLATMQELHQRHQGRVTLLDHHRSSMLELDGQVPNCTFDMEESGATLAWEYAQQRWGTGHKNQRGMPELLAYVKDRDLWTWQLPMSRQVSAAIESYPKTFEAWDAFEVKNLMAKGIPLMEYQDEAVVRLVSKTIMRNVCGHTVPTVNSANLTSEAGEALLEKYPESPFAAIYADVPSGDDGELVQRWSLRSRPGFDVSEVARQMGGGGHARASGFTVTLGRAPIGTQEDKTR